MRHQAGVGVGGGGGACAHILGMVMWHLQLSVLMHVLLRLGPLSKCEPSQDCPHSHSMQGRREAVVSPESLPAMTVTTRNHICEALGMQHVSSTPSTHDGFFSRQTCHCPILQMN